MIHNCHNSFISVFMFNLSVMPQTCHIWKPIPVWIQVNNFQKAFRLLLSTLLSDYLQKKNLHDNTAVQRSVNHERTFWYLQIFQKTNLNVLFFCPSLYMGRNFSFIHFKNLKHQNVLSKLTDLQKFCENHLIRK